MVVFALSFLLLLVVFRLIAFQVLLFALCVCVCWAAIKYLLHALVAGISVNFCRYMSIYRTLLVLVFAVDAIYKS